MNRNKRINWLKIAFMCFMVTGLFYSCGRNQVSEKVLPILGEREVISKEINGQSVIDTLYPKIPDFNFINQDSQVVTNQNFAGKIYVSDFFFTSCPTICPRMKSQMLRVYEEFKENKGIMLLSYTIDPKHDSVAILQEYADKLGVSSEKWHFVTGEKDSIYAIAQNYLVTAMEDEKEAGGFVHSGAFILVDENRHIRGIYDGTNQEQVDRLLKDISLLLNESKHEI